jgi:hypothetical protein
MGSKDAERARARVRDRSNVACAAMETGDEDIAPELGPETE